MQVKAKGPLGVVLAIVIGVVILVCLGLGAWRILAADSAIQKDKYQAVFLTNGQVYFCKLSNITSQYAKCTDIYYLQVQQKVQPDENKDKEPQVQLAKLGTELHGPQDEMQISRDQVLFWENLKNDSKVVEAIQKNQQK